MKQLTVIIAVVLAWMACPALAGIMFSGSLSSALGQIDGKGSWVDPGHTTIVWEVTDQTTYWHYKYILTVPDADVSHLVIEVSDGFGDSDFFNDTGPYTRTEIDFFTAANGNPDIPEGMFGLKFDNATGQVVTIEFDSTRMPVWGDFYAKDGGKDPVKQAWNAGFTPGDDDPGDPIGDGSVGNHILVPDSVIPEPASLSLLGLGAVALLKRRRKPGGKQRVQS